MRTSTVVEAALNRRLTTVEAVREELGLPEGAEADRLGRLIDRASGMITGRCGREFARETVRDSFRGALGRCLLLSRAPAEVLTITLDGSPLDAGLWAQDPGAGILIRTCAGGSPIVWGCQAVEVVFASGYLLPGDADLPGVARLPTEVEHACILLVTSLRAGAGRDPLLRSESEEGVGSSSWLDPRAGTGGLPLQVAEMLARHVRVVP